ncbi:unnamed protein product [Chrysoparadoxa australica]
MVLDLPIIDLGAYDTQGEPIAVAHEACRSLHEYGAVLVRDPRVALEDGSTFIDMMEAYFEGSDGVTDARPELSYQVGVTPEHIEKPRDHSALVKELPAANSPASAFPPKPDPKWRFFWRVGPRPAKTKYPDLNAAPVIPKGFPQWSKVMDNWGEKMLGCVHDLSKILAVGFGMEPHSFTSRTHGGPHLLAPTGSNFSKFGDLGTVLAGFHYDLNFLTIHGKSRYPGLHIWLRDGSKHAVHVPDGCLLVQAGIQMEYLTNGHVKAGFHEVVVTEDTLSAIEAAKQAGRSLWRVSSTCFVHISSDTVLKPLGQFEAAGQQGSTAHDGKYLHVEAGQQVLDELRAISLSCDRAAS